MSTIIVVKKDGVAAIAADSLTKWGSAKETAGYVVNHSKIMKVQDCYLAMAGPATAMLALKHYFGSLRKPAHLGSVDEIYESFLALHAVMKERYFLNPEENEEDAYESSQMDVLIASPRGIFGVGADRVVQEYVKYYAYGYGGDYAMGAMYAVYDDAQRTPEAIARLGVEAAAEFDDSTGLPVTSHTLKLRAGARRAR